VVVIDHTSLTIVLSAGYWSEGQNWARHMNSNRWQEEGETTKAKKLEKKKILAYG